MGKIYHQYISMFRNNYFSLCPKVYCGIKSGQVRVGLAHEGFRTTILFLVQVKKLHFCLGILILSCSPLYSLFTINAKKNITMSRVLSISFSKFIKTGSACKHKTRINSLLALFPVCTYLLQFKRCISNRPTY